MSSDHSEHVAVWIQFPMKRNPNQLISVALHYSMCIGSSTSFEYELKYAVNLELIEVNRLFLDSYLVDTASAVSYKYHGILFRVVWRTW